MEQFNLEEWLQDKSRKVVTRDGKPVRIVCWDSPNKGFPIVGFIDDNPTVFVWDKYGYVLSGHRESNRDLFFADKENELTKFEKELEMMMVSFSNENLGSDVRKEMPKQKLHNYAHRLLDFARKELQPEFDKEMDKILAETDKVVYQKGQQEALKDLLKWKKITEAKQNYLAYGYLSHDGYYLSIKELIENLPKEK